MAVNPEGRQPLLRVPGQHGGEIDRARTLRAVETPHGLRSQRVGVHRLGPVTPARRDGERDADVFATELLRTGRGLGHATDRGVGDDAFDRLAGRIAQLRGDEFGRGFGHVHRLDFERFTHAAEAAVDRRADADFRKVGENGVGHGEVFSVQITVFSVLKFSCADWS